MIVEDEEGEGEFSTGGDTDRLVSETDPRDEFAVACEEDEGISSTGGDTDKLVSETGSRRE